MTSSETETGTHGRLNEVVESSRTRLRAVIENAEERVDATIPRLRERMASLRERAFEDADRLGGYVTEGLAWAGARLPHVDLPLSDKVPSAEEVAGIWFDNVGRAVDLQRKLTLEWIAALREANPSVTKAKATRAAKKARSAA